MLTRGLKSYCTKWRKKSSSTARSIGTSVCVLHCKRIIFLIVSIPQVDVVVTIRNNFITLETIVESIVY